LLATLSTRDVRDLRDLELRIRLCGNRHKEFLVEGVVLDEESVFNLAVLMQLLH
jgi:hypothetical protein